MTDRGRWHVVHRSEFAHEQEAIELLRARLPDSPPFRGWSNALSRSLLGFGPIHRQEMVLMFRISPAICITPVHIEPDSSHGELSECLSNKKEFLGGHSGSCTQRG